MTEGETPMDCLIKSLVTTVQVLVLAVVLGGGFGASAAFVYKGLLAAIDKFGFGLVGTASVCTFMFLTGMLREWLWEDSSREQNKAQRIRNAVQAEIDRRALENKEANRD